MLSACSAMPQVMQRAEARPLPMAMHQRSTPGVSRPPLRPVAQDADETVPLVNGGLAAKALKGRQSIAQLQRAGRMPRYASIVSAEQCSLTAHQRQEACHCPQSVTSLMVRHGTAHVKSLSSQVML